MYDGEAAISASMLPRMAEWKSKAALGDAFCDEKPSSVQFTDVIIKVLSTMAKVFALLGRCGTTRTSLPACAVYSG